MNPLRRTYRRLAAQLLLAALLGAASPSLAVAEGYWACSEGAWVAAGEPGSADQRFEQAIERGVDIANGGNGKLKAELRREAS